MSGTNDSFSFGTSLFSNYRFDELPKGVMFSISMNPYNGLVLVRYNHNDVALDVTDGILLEMSERIDYLSDALDCHAGIGELAKYSAGELSIPDFEPCPFCGKKPEYVEFGGDRNAISCCGGRLRMMGFESRKQAVREWNDRTLFKVA